jgi:hypothetical protein
MLQIECDKREEIIRDLRNRIEQLLLERERAFVASQSR